MRGREWALPIVDTRTGPDIFVSMKSLREIETAIALLPPESRRQLVCDLPALCPEAFPADGWDGILADPAPRPALTSLLDSLDAQYRQKPEQFPVLNEDSLRKAK